MIVVFESLNQVGLPIYAHSYFTRFHCRYVWVDSDRSRRAELRRNRVNVDDWMNIDHALQQARVVAIHFSELSYYTDQFRQRPLDVLVSKVKQSCPLLVFTRDTYQFREATIEEIARTPLASRVSFLCDPALDQNRISLVRLLKDACTAGSCIDAAGEALFLLNRMGESWTRTIFEMPPLTQRLIRHFVHREIGPGDMDWIDLVTCWKPQELAAKLQSFVAKELAP